LKSLEVGGTVIESLKHFEELFKEAAEAREGTLRFGAKLLSAF
jgi:hypothetical protein